MRGCCVYGSVAEGGGRGVGSELRLQGRVCSMLMVMLGGDLDIRVGVRVRVMFVDHEDRFMAMGGEEIVIV